MYKYSKILKIIGLTLALGVTLVLFALEAFVPGMYGVHWFAMYTFMPGLGIYFIGVLLKEPTPDSKEKFDQKQPLSIARRVLWGVVLLFLAIITISNLIGFLLPLFNYYF